MAPVPVPHDVLVGLDSVRDSGLTNMLDRPMVALIAMELGHVAAAQWVHEHRDDYARGVFHGFTVAGNAG